MLQRRMGPAGLTGTFWGLFSLSGGWAGIGLLSDLSAQVSPWWLRLQHVEFLLKRRHSWAVHRGRRSGHSLSWGWTNLERMM